MNLEDFDKRLADIQSKIESVDFFSRLAASDFGKRMLEDLRIRKNILLSLYGSIDADKPSCNVAISHLQGRELELNHAIQSMTSPDATRKALDEMFISVQNDKQQYQKNLLDDRSSEFVSSRIKKSEGV